MPVRIFNTFSRKLEDFVPLEEGTIKFYVCGPTVYDYFHVGNARCFVVFDVIRRYFEYRGYTVLFVQNITDIDDKIINRARELNVTPDDVAHRYTQAFFEDSEKLRIKPATVGPKATNHIPDIIAMIESLMEKGYAYQVNGDVFFEVGRFRNYGALSGKDIESLRSGERVEVDSRKRSPLDFALWKSAKPGEPKWESPWGFGRPGWHSECSAMSMKYLGTEFDIHAGAEDLLFPHHENEIAQSQCATGKQFARYWLHLGFLKINDIKMSKSLGNFLSARELLQRFRPEAIRLYYLQKHYRSPINYTEELLQQAETAVDRIFRSYTRLKKFLDAQPDAVMPETIPPSLPVMSYKHDLEMAMDNDFDTPGAISALFDMFRWINSEIDKIDAMGKRMNNQPAAYGGLGYALKWIENVDAFLGVIPREDKPSVSGINDIMMLLIGIRERLRKEKNFQLADHIRNELEQLGYVLEDSPTGTTWRSK